MLSAPPPVHCVVMESQLHPLDSEHSLVSFFKTTSSHISERISSAIERRKSRSRPWSRSSERVEQSIDSVEPQVEEVLESPISGRVSPVYASPSKWTGQKTVTFDTDGDPAPFRKGSIDSHSDHPGRAGKRNSLSEQLSRTLSRLRTSFDGRRGETRPKSALGFFRATGSESRPASRASLSEGNTATHEEKSGRLRSVRSVRDIFESLRTARSHSQTSSASLTGLGHESALNAPPSDVQPSKPQHQANVLAGDVSMTLNAVQDKNNQQSDNQQSDTQTLLHSSLAHQTNHEVEVHGSVMNNYDQKHFTPTLLHYSTSQLPQSNSDEAEKIEPYKLEHRMSMGDALNSNNCPNTGFDSTR
ncbi:hypothetical protein BJ742DRAFT_267371 [Cladochytrium replicatum]|nr:hypothetical protein BJ742DRAFT_267371 [Cladochytrium replicatum]